MSSANVQAGASDAAADQERWSGGAAGLPYKWKAFWVISIAMFIMVMDFSVTSIALPSIAKDFDLTLRVVSWVTIAASLTITAFLLPLGRLADIAGRRRVHLSGVALFCAGSLIAFFSASLPMLIGGRVVMALGAAMNQAVGMAIVTSVFPPEERGKSLGMITTVVGIGAIAGPIVGGPLVDIFSWRAVYLLLFAPSVFAFLLAFMVLDDARIGTVKRAKGVAYDWIGASSSAMFLSLMIFTISNPFDLPWTSPGVLAGAVIASAFLGVFVWWELRVDAPMISLRFFRSRQFTWSAVARLVGFLGTAASWFLMPFYLEDVLDYTPGTVGLVIFVGAFGMAATAFFSGRLSDRFGARRFVLAGLALGVLAGLSFSTFKGDTSLWTIMPALLLNGVGQGMWMAPNMSITLGAVERSNYGIVSAFLNLLRNISSVSGTAIVTLIVVSVMVGRGVGADLGAVAGSGDPAAANAFVAGMRIAFIMQSALLALAFGAAFITRDATRVRRLAMPQPAGAGDGK